MNFIFNLMKSVRRMVSNVFKAIREQVTSIRIDIKDHVFVSVMYIFTVVNWAMVVSDFYGLIAIYTGFGIAIFWELYNAEFKVKNLNVKDTIVDLMCYVIVALPLWLKLSGAL